MDRELWVLACLLVALHAVAVLLWVRLFKAGRNFFSNTP
jgi:hypothetical protein